MNVESKKYSLSFLIMGLLLIMLAYVTTAVVTLNQLGVQSSSIIRAQGGDDDIEATPSPSEPSEDDTATTAVVSEASPNTGTTDSEVDPAVLTAVGLVGIVIGAAGTSVMMGRRIKKLRGELREAQIVIQAIKPAAKRKRQRPDSLGSDPRSIAAAKKIGGQSLLRTGQIQEAYMMFLDAIEHDEDDDEAWLWAGIAAMKLKQYEVAQQTLLQARTLGNEKAEDALRKLKELMDKKARTDSLMQSVNEATAAPDFDAAEPTAKPKRQSRRRKPESPKTEPKSASEDVDLDVEPDFDF